MGLPLIGFSKQKNTPNMFLKIIFTSFFLHRMGVITMLVFITDNLSLTTYTLGYLALFDMLPIYILQGEEDRLGCSCNNISNPRRLETIYLH